MALKALVISALLALGPQQLAWGEEFDLSKYTKPHPEVGKLLKGYNPSTSPAYAHEYGFGHYYQGDIILRPTVTEAAKNGRLVLTEDYAVEEWPDGIVPYVIEANFTQPQRALLQAGIDQIAAQTCVQFVPRTDQAHYVTITNADAGCYSYVGRSPQNDYNQINLQTPECMMDVGTPVHEMLHAIGFFHEFSRYDRDEYVSINTANLRPEYQHPLFIQVNFGKVPPGMGTAYGVKYNYGSVMHYSRYAGSVGICCPVFDNLKLYFGDFGSQTGLTALDTKQINAKYCGGKV